MYTAGMLSRGIAAQLKTSRAVDSEELDIHIICEAEGMSRKAFLDLPIYDYERARGAKILGSLPENFRVYLDASTHKVVACTCECTCEQFDRCIGLMRCETDCNCLESGEVICEIPPILGRHQKNANGNAIAMAESLTGLAFSDEMSINRAYTILIAIDAVKNQEPDVPFPSVQMTS